MNTFEAAARSWVVTRAYGCLDFGSPSLRGSIRFLPEKADIGSNELKRTGIGSHRAGAGGAWVASPGSPRGERGRDRVLADSEGMMRLAGDGASMRERDADGAGSRPRTWVPAGYETDGAQMGHWSNRRTRRR